MNFAQGGLDDVKAIPPQVWGVGVGIAFVLALIFHIITKKKEDAFITAGVFIYALLVGALSIFLRNHQLNSQFSTMVVALSVIRVFVDISAPSLLVLSLAPFLVNTAAAELKQRNLIPQ
jgi:hypothetical protein